VCVCVCVCVGVCVWVWVCVCGPSICKRVSKMSITKAQHMSNSNTKILNSYTEMQIARMSQAGFTIEFLILAHCTI